MTTRSRRSRLDPLLERVDELLCEEPLSVRQTDMLAAVLADPQSTTAGKQAALLNDPDGHTVKLSPEFWTALPDWGRVAEALGAPDRISRGDVFRIMQRGAECRDRLPGFVASYAWGSGTGGLGASRLERIFQKTTPDEARQRLQSAVALMDAEGPVEAYRALRGDRTGTLPDGTKTAVKLGELGPSFFTKYLYFASRASHLDPGQPQPLILDQVVAARLRTRTEALVSQNPELGDPAELAKWAWASGGWSAGRYKAYLAWAEAATAHLRNATTNQWPTRTDAIELAVFGWSGWAGGAWSDLE